MNAPSYDSETDALLAGLSVIGDGSASGELFGEVCLRATVTGISVTNTIGTEMVTWEWNQVKKLVAHKPHVGVFGEKLQVLEIKVGKKRWELLSRADGLMPLLVGIWIEIARHHIPDSKTVGSRAASLTNALSDRSVVLATAGSKKMLALHTRAVDAVEHLFNSREARLQVLDSPASFVRRVFLAKPAHSRRLSGDVSLMRPIFMSIAVLVLCLLVGASNTFSSSPSYAKQKVHPPKQLDRNLSDIAASKPMLSSVGTAPANTPPLPAASAPPLPEPASLQQEPAIASHEVFGFAPYWTLPDESSFDVAGLTTLAYFSLSVNANGSIDESGPGWNGYNSQDLADLVTRAHQAGDRVVLTITSFSQSSLDELTSDSTAGTTLGSELVPLIEQKNLDGLNVDFEGEGSTDRSGLDTLMSQLSAAVHTANPHWQVTMDTYASAAGDPGGFYDIAGLSPSVDAFFVMGYDMENPAQPSPTAALEGAGFTDTDALEQYTAVVPASKVILGVPYYGYDWTTSGPDLGATSTGSPTPMPYSEIASSGHPVYWDPQTLTPWTSYQDASGQWHQTWFDDPTSLALKAELAASFHIAGVGIWALGMDGDDPAMLAALSGQQPVVKDSTLGPGSPTTVASASGPSPSPAIVTYQTTGTYEGQSVILTPTDDQSLLNVSLQSAGSLTDFTTNDPAFQCLASASSVPVEQMNGVPGSYVVDTETPQYCATGSWIFSFSPGSAGSSPPTTSQPAATVPGTAAPPATTTTTIVEQTTTTTSTTTPVPSTTTTSELPASTTTVPGDGSSSPEASPEDPSGSSRSVDPGISGNSEQAAGDDSSP